MSSLRILVKFPSRGRPAQFLSVLRSMVELSEKPEYIFYLVTADYNDDSMGVGALSIIEGKNQNIRIIREHSDSKIHAINRDMNAVRDWDIVLLASDDMIPLVKGWDEIIRKEFIKPLDFKDLETNISYQDKNLDLDQAIWYFDGHQHRICTLVVMGRTRYDKFGYLYHPSYISLWCDNEWTEVNQPKKIDTILFKHEHPAWGGKVPMDALYQRNEAFFERDMLNFEKRKQLNFPI